MNFARLHGVTQIFVTRQKPTALRSWFAAAPVQQIVNLARDMQVTVVADRSIRRGEALICIVKRSRFGFVVLALALSVAAFYTGARFVRTTTAPTHPLTGRPIAGIATNASWLDRSAREQEEQPEQAPAAHWDSTWDGCRRRGSGHGLHDAPPGAAGWPVGEGDCHRSSAGNAPDHPDESRPCAHRERRGRAGDETDARLPEGTIDLALLVDVYHEFRYPQAMLRSIRRSLKPHGELALVEYRKEDPRIPIAPTHRMSVADIRTEVEAETFVYDRLIEDLPRQHIIVFRKQAP